MSLKLYNTLGRKLETVDWSPDHVVGLYTCGPTVYNTAHIGNLRTYIFEDVLRRTLEFNGYKVKHVMNITDVGHLTGDGDMGEDKLEAEAKRIKKDAYDIAAAHTKEFFDDLKKLNIEPPTTILKATDTIQLQIDLIAKLETKGFTYRTSDGIYFDTAKLPSYGQLSGQKASDKKAGARVEVNDEKKHPTDFALWKFSKPEDKRQMEWPSPWGVGFPGWHIECSAMSLSEFPNGLDIHCGGIDHIAVHHENEIAQNEAAGYKEFVKLWMHGEFLKLPGKRMGKSEGNAITLQRVVDKHGMQPLAYRYLTLQAHYRKPLNFTWPSLRAAHDGLQRLWASIAREEILYATNGKVHDATIQAFTDAINDDLNTAKALDVMQRMLASVLSINDKRATLEQMDKIIGLDLLGKQNDNVVLGHKELLKQYSQARQEKRFADSDKIRQQFADLGLVVEDTPTGSRLRKK